MYIYLLNPVPEAMEMAQKELKTLLPQKFHIPSSELRLLNSIGHGTLTLFIVQLGFQQHQLSTHWGCGDRSSLIAHIPRGVWRGVQGSPDQVAWRENATYCCSEDSQRSDKVNRYHLCTCSRGLLPIITGSYILNN